MLLVSSKTNDADDDMGRVSVPKRMNFWKISKGGVVIFNPKIYIADLGPLNKALQYNFLKMRGGGQKTFGTFPKNHPFW